MIARLLNHQQFHQGVLKFFFRRDQCIRYGMSRWNILLWKLVDVGYCWFFFRVGNVCQNFCGVGGGYVQEVLLWAREKMVFLGVEVCLNSFLSKWKWPTIGWDKLFRFVPFFWQQSTPQSMWMACEKACRKPDQKMWWVYNQPAESGPNPHLFPWPWLILMNYAYTCDLSHKH